MSDTDWSRFAELLERFEDVPVDVRQALLRSLERNGSGVAELVAKHLEHRKNNNGCGVASEIDMNIEQESHSGVLDLSLCRKFLERCRETEERCLRLQVEISRELLRLQRAQEAVISTLREQFEHKPDGEQLKRLAATEEEVLAGLEKMTREGGKPMHAFLADLVQAASKKHD